MCQENAGSSMEDVCDNTYEQPYMALTVRAPYPTEQAEKRRLMRGTNGPLYALCFGAVIYSVLMEYLAVLSTDQKMAQVLIIAFFLGAGLCLTARVLHKRKSIRQDETTYRAMLAAEPKEKLLEVYPDRAEVSTIYGKSVYLFSQVQQMLCSESILVLCTDGGELILRAEDMTPQQAYLLFAFLNERLPAHTIRVKHPLTGRQYQPLPMEPVYAVEQQPIFSAETMRRKKSKGNFLKETPWLLGASLLVAAFILPYLPLFSNSVATLGATATVAFLLQCLFWFIFTVITETQAPYPSKVILSPEGLTVTEKNITRFYRREHIAVQKKQAGVAVSFPGNRIFIKWNQMSDPIKAQQLLA